MYQNLSGLGAATMSNEQILAIKAVQLQLAADVATLGAQQRLGKMNAAQMVIALQSLNKEANKKIAAIYAAAASGGPITITPVTIQPVTVPVSPTTTTAAGISPTVWALIAVAGALLLLPSLKKAA